MKYDISCELLEFISWRWLSRNLFHDGDSHEIPHSWNPFVKVNSHEITKLSRNPIVTVNSHEITWLTKSIRDGELSRNTTKNRHENTDANLVATLFSWGWPSRWTLMKRICGGELSWKCDFRVSIIVRVDAWRCTLTYYFRESKTIFHDVFCALTKSLDSGSEWTVVLDLWVIVTAS